MADMGSKKDISVDVRDEILQVPSLWEFFIEKTVSDAKSWFASRTTAPPWGIFVGLVAATIFFGFLESYIVLLTAGFALGLLVWIILVRSGKTQTSLEAILSSINNGDFPVELKDSIIKRLRWWNMLVVPADWTVNSRIYSIRDKLNLRVEELNEEIRYWKSPEGEARLAEINESEEAIRIRHQEHQKKLNLLKSRGVNVSEDLNENDQAKNHSVLEKYHDPNKLIKYLRGKGECERQLNRISKVKDPIERASEEMVLVEALLIHCNRVIKLIDEVEALQVSVDTITSDSLNEKVKNVLITLEKRRSLVGKLNRISPKKIIGVVDYEPILAQSEISKERMINAK